jgi:hypothetical protein
MNRKLTEYQPEKNTKKTPKKEPEFEPPIQLVALHKGVGKECTFCKENSACWWIDESGRLYCHYCAAKYDHLKLRGLK